MQFQTWKTITVGDVVSTKDFEKALSALGVHCQEIFGGSIEQDIEISNVKKEIDLVNVSPRELGFSENTNLSIVAKKAILLGLKECPRETPLQLRIKYLDQPAGESLIVASGPYSDSALNSYVMRVATSANGEKRLDMVLFKTLHRFPHNLNVDIRLVFSK